VESTHIHTNGIARGQKQQGAIAVKEVAKKKQSEGENVYQGKRWGKTTNNNGVDFISHLDLRPSGPLFCQPPSIGRHFFVLFPLFCPLCLSTC